MTRRARRPPFFLLLLGAAVGCGVFVPWRDDAAPADATPADAASDALSDAGPPDASPDASCETVVYAGEDCADCAPAETGCPACWLYLSGGAVVAFAGECCAQPCCQAVVPCP